MHVPASPNAVRVPEDTALVAARHRLADRTAARIDATGLLPAPCRSRVLETALALRLLDLTGRPRERTALARFLDIHREAEPTGTLERVLADCAISGTPLPDAVVTSVLADFEHFTAGRKRNLLRAVAIVFGRPRTDVVPEPHERGTLHPWASAVATACEVIIAGRATRQQRMQLLAALGHSKIWDGHLLCHLLSTHALRELPGTTGVVTGAVQRLLATRQPDGGIPFIESLDVFCSALAGLGMLALPCAGTPVRTIADRIADLQGPQGGWGYATGVGQADVDTTALALELLSAADPPRYAPQVGKGMAYLHEIRGADGGFPTYRRGATSEVAMTAAAANALDLDASGLEVLAGAAGFITAHQNADGGFESGWSRSRANTLCRVLLALSRARAADALLSPETRTRIRTALSRSTQCLVRHQNPDGGWGHLRGEHSDPISTAFALIGLARHPRGAAAVPRGLRYLLAGQRTDGGFVSRPDSTGPRGFVYDVPVLAELYPLLAMAHLAPTAPVVLTRPRVNW